jgi:hypothetical protein
MYRRTVTLFCSLDIATSPWSCQYGPDLVALGRAHGL